MTWLYVNSAARPLSGNDPPTAFATRDRRLEMLPLTAAVPRALIRECADAEIRVTVSACGVCRTDLHVIDGELAHPTLPLVPGHAHTCGVCSYCFHGHENLCEEPQFAGYTRDGGFATSIIANARYAFPLPEGYSDAALAPLLCAGLIGWRSVVRAGSAQHIGLYGFGAAAHLVAQVARWQGRTIYALTRPGDSSSQAFARSWGAVWAGDSTQLPPRALDAAIIFAPDGDLSLKPCALCAKAVASYAPAFT